MPRETGKACWTGRETDMSPSRLWLGGGLISDRCLQLTTVAAVRSAAGVGVRADIRVRHRKGVNFKVVISSHGFSHFLTSEQVLGRKHGRHVCRIPCFRFKFVPFADRLNVRNVVCSCPPKIHFIMCFMHIPQRIKQRNTCTCFTLPHLFTHTRAHIYLFNNKCIPETGNHSNI